MHFFTCGNLYFVIIFSTSAIFCQKKGTVPDDFITNPTFYQQEESVTKNMLNKTVQETPIDLKNTKQFYWATFFENDKGELDVIVFPKEEQQKMERLLEELAKKTVEEGESGYRVSENDPLLPKIFGMGERMSLITTYGLSQIEVKGFKVGQGPSEYHLFVEVEGKGIPKGTVGLVVKRLDIPTSVKLRPAIPADIKLPEITNASKELKDHLYQHVCSKSKRIWERMGWSPKMASWVEGRFANDGKWLVSIFMPRSQDLTEDGLSGLVILNSSGKIVSVIAKPCLSIIHHYAKFLIDIDLDDIDEVIIEEAYYEGNYMHFLRWNGINYDTIVLTGDGA